MTVKKYNKEDIDKIDDLTDYERLKKMSESEVLDNARADKDAPLQSETELDKFKKVKRPRGTNSEK